LFIEKTYIRFSRKISINPVSKLAPLLLAAFLSLFCSPSKNTNESKITFDLSEFKDDGSRERIKGYIEYICYEFCIPASEEFLKEVRAIDSTAGALKGSKGRSGC
jgi:hypothetical protein